MSDPVLSSALATPAPAARRMADRPALSPVLQPPMVHGAAALTTAAMQGTALVELSVRINRMDAEPVARLYDAGLLHQLAQRPDEAARLQSAALAVSQLYRVRRDRRAAPRLRVLALMSPGDLMANTPLDFITRHLDVQLDLLFMLPGVELPDVVPEHDVMVCAASEPDPATLARMRRLYRVWPRPVLNDPGLLPLLARDRLSELLCGLPGLYSPPAVLVGRHTLRCLASGALELAELVLGLAYPVLVRPAGSHAGQGLEKVEDAEGMRHYLARHGDAGADAGFYVTGFVDYRSADGLFRKYRVAFIEGRPFLCHMAVSGHWMVHYLNAGMTESPARRAEEAAAMAGFEDGFADRHRAAFARLNCILPFDFYTIDCAELPDGRLVVFEADTAAIIHMMDAVELFAYKHEQMARVFAAFEAMLQTRLLEG